MVWTRLVAQKTRIVPNVNTSLSSCHTPIHHVKRCDECLLSTALTCFCSTIVFWKLSEVELEWCQINATRPVIGRINLKFDSNQNHNQLILLYYFESKIKINLPYLIRNQKSKIKIKIRIKNHKNLKVKTSKNFFVFYNLIGKIGIEK